MGWNDAERVRAARARALAFDGERELERVEAMGARVLDCDELPDLLRSIIDPPTALYALGELAPRHAVAVVGSRGPTPYGLRMARRLAGDAAAAGLVVVSGLARGIDAAAHRAALDAGGTTWAVIGSGLGCLYPPEHADLARELVAAGGALLTEMPLDMAPLPDNFPRRNRLVSGLAWATVVVEGRHRSGSGVTAKQALEQGREVLAVPGPADSPLSEVPLRLLAGGAGLARNLDDILAVLPPGAGRPAPTRPDEGSPPDLEDEEGRILSLLGSDALSLDELARASGLDTARLSSIMFGLELKSLVVFVPGQRYAQKTR
ncbi:MAG: DNA-processing protein DprA [Elusimicrobiota bacterium]|nr:DNA-processing protein DprA [Elusimicrobiota bacterium]